MEGNNTNTNEEEEMGQEGGMETTTKKYEMAPNANKYIQANLPQNERGRNRDMLDLNSRDEKVVYRIRRCWHEYPFAKSAKTSASRPETRAGFFTCYRIRLESGE